MSTEPDTLTSARADLADLERDHARLTEMLAAANQRLRDARRGTDAELRKASLEAAGLAQAVTEVDAELDAAREHLANLETEQRRADLEAQHDHLAAKLDQLANAYAARINAAVDTALEAIAEANTTESDARQTHDRLSIVARDLGRPAPRAYRPPTAQRIVAAREHPVREDERVTVALLEASQAHPVARGATRDTLTRERVEREARARAAQYRTQWEARAALANGEHGANAETADAARAWLASNPRPAEVSA